MIKKYYLNIILLLIIIGLVFKIMNSQEIDIYSIKSQQRISFMNGLFFTKMDPHSTEVLSNLILMDISQVGEGLVNLNDTLNPQTCLGWEESTKLKYIKILEDSKLVFSKEEKFIQKYMGGVDIINNYCKN